MIKVTESSESDYNEQSFSLNQLYKQTSLDMRKTDKVNTRKMAEILDYLQDFIDVYGR